MTKRTLVVGSTGFLGRTVVASLVDAGAPVRALVRPGRDNEVTRGFAAANVQIVRGDLKDSGSLDAACHGISTIVSTATSTRSRLEGDSIESVDAQGHAALVEAARAAGVRRFVFVSFVPSDIDYALQRAKRSVMDRIQRSGLEYTILQPTYFVEGWLSPALGFDPVNGRARLFGGGERPLSWISIGDVAGFVAAAVTDDRLIGKIVPLGGPDALSQRDVLRLFQELGAPPVTVDDVPEATLESQRVEATDSLQEAYAALMLGVARGQVVDPQPALELVPRRLATVREFAVRAMKSLPTAQST